MEFGLVTRLLGNVSSFGGPVGQAYTRKVPQRVRIPGLAPCLFSLLHVLREYGTSWDPAPASLGPRTSSSVPPVARTDHRAGPDHAHGQRQDRLGGILHEYRFDRHVRARVLTYLQRELAAGWRSSG